MKYYYKVDRKGFPIPGTNNNTNGRKVVVDRVVFFDALCCDEPYQYSSSPIKYFVRVDGFGIPVPFTLVRGLRVPRGRWIEIFPICCPPEEDMFDVIFNTFIEELPVDFVVSIIEQPIPVPTAGAELSNITIPNDGTFYSTDRPQGVVTSLPVGSYTIYIKVSGDNPYNGASAIAVNGVVTPPIIGTGINSSPIINYIFNFTINSGGNLTITLP